MKKRMKYIFKEYAMKDKLRKIKNFLPVFFTFVIYTFNICRTLSRARYRKSLVTNRLSLQKFLCVTLIAPSTMEGEAIVVFLFYVFFVFLFFQL